MVEISAALVKELREATNVGMMECKRALQETGGDKEKAIKYLRERGMAIAGKKADRTAKEGIITAAVGPDHRFGVMIEVNCETDFVARNEGFQKFVKSLLEKAKELKDKSLADAAKDEVVAKIAEIGENILVRRNVRFDLQGTGVITSYVHLGNKVGVMLEVGCEKPETIRNVAFLEAAKDVCLHVAAAHPHYLTRKEVPEATIQSEKEIYAKQVTGKPANIVEKIVNGKLDKYFAQVCLLEQPFVKEPNETITDFLANQSKHVGDVLSIRRFVRYQLGEG